eukprot:1014350-Prymnesium_polylepis.1
MTAGLPIRDVSAAMVTWRLAGSAAMSGAALGGRCGKRWRGALARACAATLTNFISGGGRIAILRRKAKVRCEWAEVRCGWAEVRCRWAEARCEWAEVRCVWAEA